MPPETKDRFFHWKNTPIRWREEGKGKVVVLLHGFLESLEIWDDYSTELSRRYRVISVDLPGHGKSGNTGYVHSMELMAECVRELLKSLRIRRMAVIGHSMGGYVSLALAEKYPEMIRAMVLFHSSARADTSAKKRERTQAIQLVKRDHRSFIRIAIPRLFAEETRDRYRSEIRTLTQRAAESSQQGIIAALEGMKNRPDRTKVLEKTDFPVLFIAAKKDAAIPLPTSMAQIKLPAVSQSLVTENGHMGFIEDRDICLEAILGFLS